MFQVEQLSVHYPLASPLWDELSFMLPPGSFTGIQGESGCGKTTLLYSLCNVIPYIIHAKRSGRLFFQGTEITQILPNQLVPTISMMMQEPSYQLFFPNVEQELLFGPANLCLPREQIQQRKDNIVSQLNIASLLALRPSQLSFGEQKLVSFAALLMLDTHILLLDEPTAGLSAASVDRILACLLQEQQKGKIILFADHHSMLFSYASGTIEHHTKGWDVCLPLMQ